MSTSFRLDPIPNPKLLSESPLSHPMETLPQISVKFYDFTLFQTPEGYRGGYILTETPTSYHVLLTRDNTGSLIHQKEVLPRSSLVIPQRLTSQLDIWTNLKTSNFLKAGMGISGSYGSGLKGSRDKIKGYSSKFPIYTPLTLHNKEHHKLFSLAVETLTQALISSENLDRVNWLVNACLYVDDFPMVSKEILVECCTNFLNDYYGYPPGTLIREPINYILDSQNIDGLITDDFCISYIPTTYDGIEYI